MDNINIDSLIKALTEKPKVNSTNFEIWSTNINLKLRSKSLSSFIHKESFKIIKKNSADYNKEKCIEVEGYDDYYYISCNDNKVTKEQIENDNKVKEILYSNLDDETKLKINFDKNTSYSIWSFLNTNFKKSNEKRKLLLKSKLDLMMYNKNEDFGLFLSNLNNIFDKLEDLNAAYNNQEIFNCLFNCLPKEIIIFANPIAYKDNWKECGDFLMETIPRIKLLNELKTAKQNKVDALYSSSKQKHSYNNNTLDIFI